MRVGILGTNWGLMHVGAFRAAGADLVALCGRDPAKTAATAAREGIPVATTDLARLCDAAEVVVVAGPDALHPAHAAQALAAGCHVLVEKPLARTATEADALLALARTLRPGQVCAVCFPYRMLPPVAALERWLRGQTPVRHVAVTVLNGFAAAEGRATAGPMLGASGDFGGVSHVLDAALWLAGAEPVWVQAILAGRPVHSVGLQVGLATGGHLHLTHLAAPEPGLVGHWTLVGDAWQARLAGGYEPALGGWRIGPAEVYEGGHWRVLAPRVEPHPGLREPWAEAHVAVARAFLGVIRGAAWGALAPVADGARVQRVLAAAMDAERNGQRGLVAG